MGMISGSRVYIGAATQLEVTYLAVPSTQSAPLARYLSARNIVFESRDQRTASIQFESLYFDIYFVS
jgi:hypothetical protein